MSDQFSAAPLARRSSPPPPWRLWGSALVATFAVRAAAVRPFIPAPLSLLSLPGGLATGYIGVWRYGAASTLQYSELVAGVLVRHRWRVAPYITHIGVDSLPAQQAGREYWYLPKQLWQFEWQFGELENGVHVWEGSRLVCAISEVPINAGLWPLRRSISFLTMRGEDVALITGDFDVRMAYTPWKLQPGPDSPLLPLKPTGPVATLVLKGVVDVHPLQVIT